MAAKDLGSKFICFKCSTKFYDMKKPDPVCPKCGADQRESPANKPAEARGRGRLAPVARAIEPVEPAAPEAEAESEDEDIESIEEDADEPVVGGGDEEV